MTGGRFALTVMMSAMAASAMLADSAHAGLKLCNRMSYIVEAAIAVEERGVAASRGWFRVVPGECRVVLQGTPPASQLFLHARVPAIYGPSPLPQTGTSDFCVAEGNFAFGDARTCRGGQKAVPFSAVRPAAGDPDSVIHLAEDAEYTDEQARDAGIQRLLVAAGYDATPIDGIRGAKTDGALTQFIQDNKLTITAAARSDFFDVLLDAAQKPGNGFSWCNETSATVMAALGFEDQSALVTRGWYRVEPGKCLRPDLTEKPRRIYSFAEAVDAEGRAIRKGGKPLVWGGDTLLCTRSAKFEIADQSDCAAKGLTVSGFAAIDLAEQGPTTVRFK